MAKRVKPTKPGARGSGRVTPKASSRYTPPIPKAQKVSPKIVPILMFTLLGLGMLSILLNYVGLLPGGTKNEYLIGGLVLITGGFITATQYH
jgi:hypothetical protein